MGLSTAERVQRIMERPISRSSFGYEGWNRIADFARLLRHSNNGYEGRIVYYGYDG